MQSTDELCNNENVIKLNEKSRVITAVIIILLCVAVFAGLCLYQYFRFARYEAVDISGIPVADESEYCWEIEDSIDNGGYFLLNGWIVKTGESILTHSIDIVVEKNDGTAYLVPTEMTERKDLSEKLNGNDAYFDYAPSGFSAAVNKHYAETGDRLFIIYRNNGRYELVDLSTTL